MRFTADIPKPDLESLDIRFGVVLLAIVFLTFIVAVTSAMSLLEGLLLILQVVVMAGLTIILAPQLIDGEVTPETFTDYSVLTIILVVASRQWLTFGVEHAGFGTGLVVGDTMASASLLILVIWAVMMINVNTWGKRVFKIWSY